MSERPRVSVRVAQEFLQAVANSCTTIAGIPPACTESAPMDPAEWEALRAELIERLRRVPPVEVVLKDSSLLSIRSVAEQQAQAVHNVTSQAFREHRGVLDPPNGSDTETPEDVSTQMSAGGALIGYISEEPVASARITLCPDHLYVSRVGVIPARRGNGACTALMRRIEGICALLQMPGIELGTREKLSANIELYVKLGYEIVSVQRHARGPDMIVLFRKRIPASL